jgi:trehalose 6-phosphate synthase
MLVAVLAVAPFGANLVERWSQRDIELRSALIFNSLSRELEQLVAAGAGDDIARLFERVTLDERLLAIGYCDGAGVLRYRSGQIPASFSCREVTRDKRDRLFTVTPAGRPIAADVFPIESAPPGGHLVLIHDLTFAEQRASEAKTWLLIALLAVAVAGAALAALVALLIMRNWLRGIRNAVQEVRSGNFVAGDDPGRSGVQGELRTLVTELAETQRSIDASTTNWNRDTLRMVLAKQLPDTQIMVVSNREPYIHYLGDDGHATLQVPASGLVAAYDPVMRACGGTWIAHGSGSADRETADADGRLRVPPDDPLYTLRRVWLSDDEQEGYYYGLANEGLWPLCHIAFVRPTFREADWLRYKAVNERFADAVAEEANRPDPIILVQDYHFALLPKMIRERLPEATIVTFWHIPWPNAEVFGICPWKEEIISGLLGSTVLGFHTRFHCNNFMDTVDRFMETRIDRERASVTSAGHETFVRSYPISIEWPPVGLRNQAPVEQCRKAVRSRYRLPEDARIAVGIERFDYTKGIVDRLQAIDRFLTTHPEWKGRFVFLQIAAPTRSKLASYRDLHNEAEALAEDINARHGTDAYQPIRLIVEHQEPERVFELFRAADLCIVSSLHDGMNLVAKEFVAARDDEKGVLILSSFAGASRELSEALIVNPYDTHAVSETISHALQMPEAEQRLRMQAMRDLVRARNVHRWAGQMLLDAAQLRRRDKILRAAHQPTTEELAAQRRAAS